MFLVPSAADHPPGPCSLSGRASLTPAVASEGNTCGGRVGRGEERPLPSQPLFRAGLSLRPSGEPLGGQGHFEPQHKSLAICKRIKLGTDFTLRTVTNSRRTKDLCIKYKILINWKTMEACTHVRLFSFTYNPSRHPSPVQPYRQSHTSSLTGQVGQKSVTQSRSFYLYILGWGRPF